MKHEADYRPMNEITSIFEDPLVRSGYSFELCLGNVLEDRNIISVRESERVILVCARSYDVYESTQVTTR